ncbi:3-hydroxyacyl-CoA dehydrogenase NAD-binding domain-containing protein [Aliiroseovarius sp. YM-037]|uniref:3-hydroxyacyl-CoA dehydrogenase NAD-binding domain-containing protein n=1 Tax=Aliiroseovarius sp. YM-037 TaxID=3341728 RepID=UPI003A811A19
MDQAVTVTVEDGVAVLTIQNPPVNALNAAVRTALVDAIDEANADPRTIAIVIIGDGRTFSAGADIDEFGKPFVSPWLPEVCNRVEASAKPVVAALHGTTLGGGFELALAAHYRIADPRARVGLPEVTLGILPGAGGTQRTPRLAGAAIALDMMLSGRPISADEAASAGLIDEISDGDVRAHAIAFAASLTEHARRPTGERRDGFADSIEYEQVIAAARQEFGRSPLIAQGKIIDCVEAALLLPFEGGLGFEESAFLDCLETDQSAALRHVFFAERRTAKIPELEGATPRPVELVGLVGREPMVVNLAALLLDAGLGVVLLESGATALADATGRVERVYDHLVSGGNVTAHDAAERLSRLTGVLQYDALSSVDMVIEATPEDMDIKKSVFGYLDGVLKPGAVLVTTTSCLDVNDLTQHISRPQDVLGLHFNGPGASAKLVEVVVGTTTAPDVVATGFALAKRLGKAPVRSGIADGLIGGAVMAASRHAADLLVEEGATPYQIDAAMRAWGFALGPYQALDAAGLDNELARRARMAHLWDPTAKVVQITDKLCELGRFGRKSGAGYYDYATQNSPGTENDEVMAVVALERQAKGIVPREVSQAEIQDRLLAAMANEGAGLLDRGIAHRPSDIDVAMIHGHGFPRARGGPMLSADLAGLLTVRNRLRDYAMDDVFWTPAPLFDELIKNGQGFDALNTV